MDKSNTLAIANAREFMPASKRRVTRLPASHGNNSVKLGGSSDFPQGIEVFIVGAGACAGHVRGGAWGRSRSIIGVCAGARTILA